jgi:hypothetical protein
MASPLEPSYTELSNQAASHGLGHPAVSGALIDCIAQSLELLADTSRSPLVSNVPGKEYFAFTRTTPRSRTSRGINEALFLDSIDEVLRTITKIINGEVPADPIELHEALYTAAISYPAGTDVTKDNDKKSPGVPTLLYRAQSRRPGHRRRLSAFQKTRKYEWFFRA